MTTSDDRQPMVYRLGTRTPCCGAIVRHVDRTTILCRLCGTVYRDVSAGVLTVFPGSIDVTSMTPERILKGGEDA